MGSRGRVTKLEKEERLADTEQYLLRFRSRSRVMSFLSKKWDVTPSTVSHWITEVHRRWRAEAGETNREQKRDDARALLNEAIFLAMNRTKAVTEYKTEDVVDDDGNVTGTRTVAKTVSKPDPDVQRVLHAVAQLRALDGLDAPLKLTLGGGTTNDTTTTIKADASARDIVLAAIKGLQPPGS